jgi:hypothetical protein
LAGGCVIVTTSGPRPGPRPHPRHTGRPTPQPVAAPGALNGQGAGNLSIASTAGNAMGVQQPPKDEPPTSPNRPSVLPAGAADGRPAGFRPGAPPAFWIWTGPRGDWRIRTTTLDSAHLFRGRVAALTGDVIDISPSKNELADRMWKVGRPQPGEPANTWVFSFKTSTHADGFTFRTTDGGCVRFDLQLDGGPMPKRIIVGKSQLEPPTNHLVICPRGKSM